MTWEVEYFKEAEKDLVKFDHSQKLHILKAIEKVSQNPLPDYEGGYGKPLGVFDLLKGQKIALVACPPIALYNVIITEKGKTPRNLS